jgi:hypothetical protein
VRDNESRIEAVAGVVVFALVVAFVGCAAFQKTVADQLSELAGRVCVEGDDVSICASKCAHEAERVRAEAEASTPIDGGASP